jgi:hypothetical protein
LAYARQSLQAQGEQSVEEKVWYYGKDGEQAGPITETDLRSLLANGQLAPEAMIWKQGMGDWASARSIHALWGAAPATTDDATAPPVPGSMAQSGSETNGLAVATLVLGVLSIFMAFLSCGCVTSIPGIVCGHLALKQFKAEPNRYQGRGMAITGLVLSYLVLLLYILFVVFVVAVGAMSEMQ